MLHDALCSLFRKSEQLCSIPLLNLLNLLFSSLLFVLTYIALEAIKSVELIINNVIMQSCIVFYLFFAIGLMQ